MSAAPSKDDEPVVRLINANGTSSVVFVCEHASSYIPSGFHNLGLKEQDRQSHAAWDPGALAVAKLLSEKLNAQLVASTVSRLVYDCNRPPEASDAMPERSERVEVPGNADLSAEERTHRIETFYEPFRNAVAKAMNALANPVLVTIHSFTPIYHGHPRGVEIGILHDSDSRLADCILSAASGSTLNVRRNEPYGPQDGVTHTLKEHAVSSGHPNVMIEIRNDLIREEVQQAQIADQLFAWLATALKPFVQDGPAKEGPFACAG